MAENETEQIQDTSEGEGKNTESNTGAENTDNSKQNSQEKTLTQTEVNEIVKRAKADAERAAKSKFEKGLEGKSILTEEEKQKLITDIETEVRTKIAMENKRAEYKAKGLSDVQLDAIQVDKPEDFDKRVSDLYGALLKKDAPVLNGGKNSDVTGNAPSTFLQLQQEKLSKMKKEYHLK